jgi:4-hydroxybenzoate polyprenyltransferase
VAVGALALVAGGSTTAAATLAVGMFGFQVSIGALNDLSDADDDRVARPDKPVAAGLISLGATRSIAIGGAAIGLLVSASFGPAVLLLGVIGLGSGYLYDLAPQRALAGPLAFAVALPTLLLWVWLAAVGTWPPGWPMLLPLAALAGPAVHLSNSLADLDTDRRSGVTSLATMLGRRRGGHVLIALDIAIWALAWLGLALIGPISPQVFAVLAVATAMAAVGAVVSLVPRTAGSPVGWLVAAVALALLAVAWGATAAT